MSTILAAPDVAILVTAFPPSISDDAPILLRTFAGDALIAFSYVQAHFYDVIRESTLRISRDDLPQILNTEPGTIPAVLQRFTAELYFSQDGRYIVPPVEIDDISSRLTAEASASFVDCVEYSERTDIDVSHLRRLIVSDEIHRWRHISSGQKDFICTETFWRGLIADIIDAVRSSDSVAEVVDLTLIMRRVPSCLLTHVTEEAALSADGDIRIDNERVIFVPASRDAASHDAVFDLRADKVNKLVRDLEQRSHCSIGLADGGDVTADQIDGDLLQSVLTAYEQSHSSTSKPSVIGITPEGASKPSRRNGAPTHASLLILPEALLSYRSTFKESIAAYAEEAWLSSNQRMAATDLVLGTLTRLPPATSSILSLLTRSEYMKELEAFAQTRIDKCEAELHGTLSEFVNGRLVSPSQLYVTATGTIRDPVLRQNLQAYVLDHLRTYFLTQVKKEALDKRLFVEKARNREFDKLQQAFQHARDLEELQSAVLKLAKKLKITDPSPEDVAMVKKRFLKSSFRFEVRHATVASVLLQNTIWILLAQQSDGIFISAGKDTSRMIKQYQAVGDAGLTQRLMQWRDSAKTGQAGENDIVAMKATARSALQEMYGEEDIF